MFSQLSFLIEKARGGSRRAGMSAVVRLELLEGVDSTDPEHTLDKAEPTHRLLDLVLGDELDHLGKHRS